VVIAIIAQALWGLLKTAIKGPLTAGVGAVARRALQSEPFSAGNVGQRQGNDLRILAV
jgi:hypothetical protein